jgi:hypothetical protein
MYEVLGVLNFEKLKQNAKVQNLLCPALPEAARPNYGMMDNPPAQAPRQAPKPAAKPATPAAKPATPAAPPALPGK